MIKARDVKQNFLKFFNNIKKNNLQYELQFEEILSLHEKSSTALIALIVSVISLFPIPGLGTLLGSFLLLLSLGFLFSYNIPIPEKIKKLTFPHKISQNILIGFFHIWNLIAKYSKSRILALSHESTKIFWFIIWIFMCILIILPVPFGNVLPSITLIVFFVGWILKDGYLLISVPILASLSFIPLLLSIEVVKSALNFLF